MTIARLIASTEIPSARRRAASFMYGARMRLV